MNKGHTPTKVWYNKNGKSCRQAFIRRFSTGLTLLLRRENYFSEQ